MPVDFNAARKILNEIWAQVLADKVPNNDPVIEELIQSSSVSIRFALPTQILGKVTAPNVNILCLQKGDMADSGMWDPRGFCSNVIVPWVIANQNVLGNSLDPYVSKPLRRPRLEADPTNVKQKDLWIKLFNVLEDIQDRNDPVYTRTRFIQTLSSVRQKLDASNFEFIVPARISLNQTKEIIREFLSEGSGGDRGVSVATALLTTIGKHFSLYSEVRRAGINAADLATGLVADIECVDSFGTLKLAVEVKERSLRLTDVKTGVLKARQSRLTEFLFNAPQVHPHDEAAIARQFQSDFNLGTNAYHLSIEEMIQVTLSLTGETGRYDFLENIGIQLNTFNTQPLNRLRWKFLLESL